MNWSLNLTTRLEILPLYPISKYVLHSLKKAWNLSFVPANFRIRRRHDRKIIPSVYLFVIKILNAWIFLAYIPRCGPTPQTSYSIYLKKILIYITPSLSSRKRFFFKFSKNVLATWLLPIKTSSLNVLVLGKFSINHESNINISNKVSLSLTFC